MILGALEGGGTKMVCAVGDETGRIREQVSIPTRTPEETMPAMIDYFRDKGISALGIATFGPIDVHRDSPDYGKVLNTPKLPWQNFNIVKPFEEALGVPVGFDTDVNGSCLGEVTYGAARGLDCVVYFTIGTGIGAGIYINGKLAHGMLHPEAGYILLRVSPKDPAGSICPFHDCCFEGLASGPSIEKRWGAGAKELKDRMEVWDLESEYIAQAMVDVIMTLSPQRIILGGGVMHQQQLFPSIRAKVTRMLNGYLQTRELSDMEHYIVPASLHDDQGIMGAIRIAEMALQGQ
ncbi:MAG: ROK family protein [Lachnospiraceae bacterium]|jgi:fructokinase|nr:ROK family protein [Lachnospiraceae bacterium]